MKKLKVKCILSLYKMTYKRNAFTKGKTYTVKEESDQFYWIVDNVGNKMNFAKNEASIYYSFDAYFKKPNQESTSILTLAEIERKFLTLCNDINPDKANQLRKLFWSYGIAWSNGKVSKKEKE